MSNELSSEEYDIIAEHVFTWMLYMVQAVSLNQMKKSQGKGWPLFQNTLLFILWDYSIVHTAFGPYIAFLASPAFPSRSLPLCLPSNIITCFLTHCQMNWNPSLPDDLALFQFGLMKRSTGKDHSLCFKSFGDCFSSATITIQTLSIL